MVEVGVDVGRRAILQLTRLHSIRMGANCRGAPTDLPPSSPPIFPTPYRSLLFTHEGYAPPRRHLLAMATCVLPSSILPFLGASITIARGVNEYFGDFGGSSAAQAPPQSPTSGAS